METLYYTAAGIFLYFISDWVLTRLERARGARFAHRNVIFFVIILGLSMVSFQLIQTYFFPPPIEETVQAVSPVVEVPADVKPPGAQ
ncbi:MAG: hypothetical protein HQM04_01230 [Magnetococcales bacterium]|nr:hypothetical protein [Magnetococcales bacterium]MBF0113642.1 hypothetical protein [Magnetococcales bacterium]